MKLMTMLLLPWSVERLSREGDQRSDAVEKLVAIDCWKPETQEIDRNCGYGSRHTWVRMPQCIPSRNTRYFVQTPIEFLFFLIFLERSFSSFVLVNHQIMLAVTASEDGCLSLLCPASSHPPPASALPGAGRGFYRSQPPRMVPSHRSRRWLAGCPQQRSLIGQYCLGWSGWDGRSIGAESNSAEPSSVWREPAETDGEWRELINTSSSVVTSDIMGNIHTVGPNQALIVSGQYLVCCPSEMSEPCEGARICCISDCVILDLSSSECTDRGYPGIVSFIATRTIFRVLGLMPITIVLTVIAFSPAMRCRRRCPIVAEIPFHYVLLRSD